MSETGIRAEGEPNPLSRVQVLVVDDMDINRRVAGDLLVAMGFTTANIQKAPDGIIALGLLEGILKSTDPGVLKRWPDLIITDRNMPGLGGAGLIKSINELYSKIPEAERLKLPAFMVVSGDSKESVRRGLDSAGINTRHIQILKKPLTLPVFTTAVQQALGEV